MCVGYVAFDSLLIGLEGAGQSLKIVGLSKDLFEGVILCVTGYTRAKNRDP